jgi:hypothetical protein
MATDTHAKLAIAAVQMYRAVMAVVSFLQSGNLTADRRQCGADQPK